MLQQIKQTSEDQTKEQTLLFALSEIIERFQIKSLERELSVINNFTTDERFIDVVVLGQFKAGKSSFINSVLGENILPTGVIPVTSIITRLKFGMQRTAFVKFLDNSVKEIKIEEIENYTTEMLNPVNEKGVALVDIFTDQLMLLRNIRIIDTPGIGSVVKHNSEITKQWFPEIGLALLAISAERPLSEEDINLMKDIQKHAAQTHIILTKSDLFTAAQLQQIIDYANKSLSTENLRNSNLIPYSTIKDAEQRRKVVMEKIFLPLRENFTSSFDQIFKHKVSTLAASCLSYLHMGLAFSSKEERERKLLKSAIISEQLRFDFVNQELNFLTTALINENREKVAVILMPFLRAISKKLLDDFDINFNEWQLNLYKLSRRFESWIENKLGASIRECYRQAELPLDDYLKSIQQHFYLFMFSFKERLQHNVQNVLGVQMKPIVLGVDNRKINRPDISVSYSFDIQLDLAWFLIPMFIFKPIFKRYFRNKIPYEVEKNLHRLISDIAENINKVIEQNKKDVNQFIVGELTTIESLLDNKRNESIKFKETMDELEKLQSGT